MINVVVPVSGGKDSQACLKLAIEKFGVDHVLGLFCDTQFEHPKTYAHVENMKTLYGVEIVRVTGGSVEEKVLRYGRFPGGGARHCTDELKMRETRIFIYDFFQKNNGAFEVWYGMRSNESHERSERYKDKIAEDSYMPHEVFPKKYPKKFGKWGIRFRMPILNWSTADVFDYLNGEQNILYSEGFERVGCFPCLASGDRWKEKAFSHDDFGKEQYKKVMVISKQIGKSIWTSKGGAFRNESQNDLFDNPGCSICSM